MSVSVLLALHHRLKVGRAVLDLILARILSAALAAAAEAEGGGASCL